MRQEGLNQLSNINNIPPAKAKVCSIKFLAPGLKEYKEYDRVINIAPDKLEKIAKSHQGVPVIIGHQKVTAANIDQIKVGTVAKVFINDKGFEDSFGKYHEPDGWAWCDITIDDPYAMQLMEDGYEFSCSYKYEHEKASNPFADYDIKEGDGRHLALVKKGKYNTETVYNNSQFNQSNNITMKDKLVNAYNEMLEKVFKPSENAESDVINNKEEPAKEMANKTCYDNKYYKNSNGEKMMINDLVEEVRNYKKMEVENIMSEEDEIEIDGEVMTVKEAISMLQSVSKNVEKSEDEDFNTQKQEEAEIMENLEEKKEEKKVENMTKQKEMQKSKILQNEEITTKEEALSYEIPSSLQRGKHNFVSSGKSAAKKTKVINY